MRNSLFLVRVVKSRELPSGFSHHDRFHLAIYGHESLTPFPSQVNPIQRRFSKLSGWLALGITEFSLSEIKAKVDIPERSLFRLLKEAVERGELLKTGKGKSIRYRFSTLAEESPHFKSAKSEK